MWFTTNEWLTMENQIAALNEIKESVKENIDPKNITTDQLDKMTELLRQVELKRIEILVESLDGSKENITAKILELPFADFKILVDEVTTIINDTLTTKKK